MTQLDKVVGQILQGSAPSDVRQLAETLKLEDKQIEKFKAQIPAALGALNPSQHSYGYMVLLEKMGGGNTNREFFEKSLTFLRTCSEEQIRISPAKFVKLCQRIREQAMSLHRAKEAIVPFLLAIQKLAPVEEYITALHAPFFQLCLVAKCYSAALPALHPDASDVDPAVTALTPRDYLLYCYYGARIHIGRKDYVGAQRLLIQALTAPTMVVNAITMAAYKKYVLVCLIHSGSVPSLPRFTSNSVVRSVKNECSRYSDIAQAYGKPDGNLDTLINKHAAGIKSDGNGGLLQLALEARTKRAIQRLTQTYLTLSLQHIAEAVGLPSADTAELHILRMIDSGEIFAKIDQVRGMVQFQEDPEAYNSPETMARLDLQIVQSMKLAAKLQHTNEELSCDKAWLSKTGGRDRGQMSLEEPADSEPGVPPL